MDFALTEEQKMIQDTAKNFAEKEIAPHVEEDEKNHQVAGAEGNVPEGLLALRAARCRRIVGDARSL